MPFVDGWNDVFGGGPENNNRPTWFGKAWNEAKMVGEYVLSNPAGASKIIDDAVHPVETALRLTAEGILKSQLAKGDSKGAAVAKAAALAVPTVVGNMISQEAEQLGTDYANNQRQTNNAALSAFLAMQSASDRFTGVADLKAAATGQDANGKPLSDVDRVSKGFIGFGSVLLMVVGPMEGAAGRAATLEKGAATLEKGAATVERGAATLEGSTAKATTLEKGVATVEGTTAKTAGQEVTPAKNVQQATQALTGGAAQAAGKTGCFAAGTPVRVPNGAIPIDSLQPGDHVYAANEHDPSAPVGVQMVEQVFRTLSPVWAISVGGRVIQMTAHHPVYERARGWIEVRDVKTGDQVRGLNGEWTGVDWVEPSDEPVTVYNIQVAQYHTFFVGNVNWGFSVWVHNDLLCNLLSKARNGVTGAAEELASRVGGELSLADKAELAETAGLKDAISKWQSEAAASAKPATPSLSQMAPVNERPASLPPVNERPAPLPPVNERPPSLPPTEPAGTATKATTKAEIIENTNGGINAKLHAPDGSSAEIIAGIERSGDRVTLRGLHIGAYRDAAGNLIEVHAEAANKIGATTLIRAIKDLGRQLGAKEVEITDSTRLLGRGGVAGREVKGLVIKAD